MNKFFQTIANIFKIEELRNRILLTIGFIAIYRLGSFVVLPGIDTNVLGNNEATGLAALLNLFAGGAFSRASVFALGIMPYISASIIIQLLSTVYPPLEQLKKEGESGRRKISQYTRYGTVVLATFQAIGMVKVFGAEAAVVPWFVFTLTTVLSLVCGTIFLMWLGEKITERGVGNGISLIIFAGIVSGLPQAIVNTIEQVRQGSMQPIALVLLLVLLLGVTSFVVFIERGQRRITVNYAQRQQGRKMFAAQKSHLPLKINMAGVIPPIFASSIILFPATLSSWFGASTESNWMTELGMALQAGQPLYVCLFGAAIIFFAFFYTALVFNPRETADNLKRSGAFIPGIRPGEQTASYIDKVMTRLTFVGAMYITAVSLLPEFLRLGWQVPFYFGGTSLLIIVVVVMDFIAQVQAHLMSQQYESLMKKANSKGKGGPGSGFGLLG